jgi:hypothetical protein
MDKTTYGVGKLMVFKTVGCFLFFKENRVPSLVPLCMGQGNRSTLWQMSQKLTERKLPIISDANLSTLYLAG